MPVKIHTHPPLCLDLLLGEDVTVSTDINHVTCPTCAYYYFDPRARDLELHFRYLRGQRAGIE